jgi:hypothetical protein
MKRQEVVDALNALAEQAKAIHSAAAGVMLLLAHATAYGVEDAMAKYLSRLPKRRSGPCVRLERSSGLTNVE